MGEARALHGDRTAAAVSGRLGSRDLVTLPKSTHLCVPHDTGSGRRGWRIAGTGRGPASSVTLTSALDDQDSPQPRSAASIVRHTPTVVPGVAPWWIAEIRLGDSQDLLVVDVVDVDTHIGHELCRHVVAMLLDIADPMV